MKTVYGVLFSCFVLLFTLNVSASHIVGGEVYYDYLGNNNYRFYFALYRDCASTGAGFDSPLPISVFTGNNVRISNHSVPFPGSTVLPIVFNNPCITPPTGICTERAIYTIVLNLPPSATGYIVSYQRCCRGPNITNLVNPDNTGLTIKAIIPPSDQSHYVNSSARFVNYPPLVICNNENLDFNHSATDPDGDSLSYELVAPHSGGTSFNPAPTPIPAPPYGNVIWGGSFSTAVPLGPGSTTTINPATGQLFVDANFIGLYVVGIRVNEWRNGVIISSVTRDFLFKVINCNITLSAVINSQENSPGFVSYCQGLTFTFDNLSFGTTNFLWDFGDPTTTTDVSTAFEPTYTYPQPGTYEVTLIANPGWPCTDTAVMTLILENPFDIDFTFQDSTCFKDNSLDFQAVIINGPPTTQFMWDFGPNVGTFTSNTAQAVTASFLSHTNNVVKLVGTYSVCKDSVMKPIYFFSKPEPDIEFEDNHECLGFTQNFYNTSTGAVSYVWDFGDPTTTTDVSTLVSPSYTYPGPGTYQVRLIASSAPSCSDTIIRPITIYEPLEVSLSHNDSMCISNNSFQFVGDVSGPDITTYTWDFGPHATPQIANTLTVSNVVYDSPGMYPVQLTAQFLQCSETVHSSVYIFSIPTADFTIEDELRCEPYPAQFINLSSYEAPLLYWWNFGDGGTSTETNPLHVYLEAGTYSVDLTVVSTIGCVDTFFVLKQDLIQVHPKPVAAFQMDKTKTHICDSQVQFVDQSEGAVKVWYYVDEFGARIDGANPSYTYLTDGTHYPTQVVMSEFGCKDTVRGSLEIEPFIVYVPNTFTPDADEINSKFFPVLPIEPVEWEMRIYNRWGELVFESRDYTDYWDGTYKNLISPDGAYHYIIRYVSCAPYANVEQITGHVNLLK